MDFGRRLSINAVDAFTLLSVGGQQILQPHAERICEPENRGKVDITTAVFDARKFGLCHVHSPSEIVLRPAGRLSKFADALAEIDLGVRDPLRGFLCRERGSRRRRGAFRHNTKDSVQKFQPIKPLTQGCAPLQWPV